MFLHRNNPYCDFYKFLKVTTHFVFIQKIRKKISYDFNQNQNKALDTLFQNHEPMIMTFLMQNYMFCKYEVLKHDNLFLIPTFTKI
jgi:hypothetical protein